MKKIRVLQFICPAGLYGAEMWILALGNQLDRERVDCRLAVTQEADEQDTSIVNRFQETGSSSCKIKLNGRFDPRAVGRLTRLIKRQEIQIIHTHGYKSDLLGLAAARIAGIKTLSTPHGFENVRDFKLQAFTWLGCKALRFFDVVAPLSEELENDMRSIGVPSSRIRMIRNGVDLDSIDAEVGNELHRAKNCSEKIIGYVGQVAHRKNLGDLLAAFDLLFREHGNTRLIIVGDGPMRQELQARAGELSSGKNIQFLGYRTDRLKIMQGFDLFCMTSSLEGIPRCIMEAMALRIPVVAYSIPGVDKLIVPGMTGLMAPFGDVYELKHCMEKVLFGPDLAGRLAQNGRRNVEQNHAAKRMAAEYMELYEELMGRRRREKGNGLSG
jgi:glycosyltransferase involved in cell wall biosynthesis